MRLYVSWSRHLAYHASLALIQSLSEIFSESLSVSISATAITRASGFFDRNSELLQAADFAIIVVSKDGSQSRWLHFEGGHLVYRLKARALVLLLDADFADIPGSPLSHLQCARLVDMSIEGFFREIQAALSTDFSPHRPIAESALDLKGCLNTLCGAERRLDEYFSLYEDDSVAADNCLYEACMAMRKAKIGDHAIIDWMMARRIPFARYGGHLGRLAT